MRRILCVAAIVSLAGGCSPSLPPKPKTYPVHGTVSLNGSPIHGGHIEFKPVDPAHVLAGQGQISKDGAYKAFVFVDQDGLVPGEFEIEIETDMRTAALLGVEPTKIPAKYEKSETSELKCTVKAEDNTIDFNLE
jgi:hypothetical protein